MRLAKSSLIGGAPIKGCIARKMTLSEQPNRARVLPRFIGGLPLLGELPLTKHGLSENATFGPYNDIATLLRRAGARQ
jgi:hypothetical protein